MMAATPHDAHGGAFDTATAVAQALWHWPDEPACAACAVQLAGALLERGAPVGEAPGPEAAGHDAPGREAAGREAAGQARALDDALIELQGPLGAGKTTFVRHLLRALGVAGRIKSPTYTVVEPYRAGALDIAHFDFYRFADARELIDAGLREQLAAPGLKLVEWPSHAAALMPPCDVRLAIEPQGDDSRQVLAQAFSPRGRALLAAVRGVR